MKWRRASIAAVLILFLAPSVRSQSDNLDVSIKSNISANKVRVGERIRLDVSVEWSGSGAGYDVSPASPPALVGLRMIGSESRVSASAGTLSVRRAMIYELEATTAGKAKVGSVQLTVHDRKTDKKASLSSDPYEVDVLPAAVSIKSLAKIPPRYALGGGLIFLALLSGMAAIVIARRGKGAPPGEKPEETMTPEKAYDDAAKAAGQLRFSGDIKNCVTSLEGAFVKWIEARYEIPSRRWPNEALGEIREKALFPVEQVEFLGTFARRCEATKFAGECPCSEDIESFFDRLAKIVHNGTDRADEGSKKPN